MVTLGLNVLKLIELDNQQPRFHIKWNKVQRLFPLLGSRIKN